MPISKEKQKLYPGGSLRSPEWLAIRAEILDREGNRCAFCKVPDRTYVRRWKYGPGFIFSDAAGAYRTNDSVYSDSNGSVVGTVWAKSSGHFYKPTKIILTIAHLDQDPTNNGEPGDRPNLKALCQKCHNTHDAPYRAANARETRLRKKALPLFDRKD